MTITKKHSMLKRLGALAMALCMTCAMAISASAATSSDVAGNYTVEFLKNGKNEVSMSDQAVGNRTAVVTVDEAGVATVTIELKPIEGYLGADGWINTINVGGTNATITKHNVTTADITVGHMGLIKHYEGFEFYETATLTIEMDTLTPDASGNILIGSVTPSTELVYADTTVHFPLPSSMANAAFDIQLVKQ